MGFINGVKQGIQNNGENNTTADVIGSIIGKVIHGIFSIAIWYPIGIVLLILHFTGTYVFPWYIY